MLRRSAFKPAGKIFFTFIFLSLLFYYPSQLWGQQPRDEGDTLAVQAENIKVVDTLAHNPRKAALYSAVLPGLGQIYNKKYWKPPIIYAGIGTLIYFIDHNNKYYKDLKQGLIHLNDTIPYNLKYFDFELSKDQLQSGKDLYKRWRDLSIILTGGLYVLQIIDATVDAYLFDWNVGEDISLRIEPSRIITPVPFQNSFGLRACLSF